MARLPKNHVLNGLTGGIGKQLVLEKYGDKTVVGDYPNMSKVKPSELQLVYKDRFAAAVAHAQSINNDPVKRKAYAKKLPKGKSVYHAALQESLRKANGTDQKKRR